jgi:hypothetical protein
MRYRNRTLLRLSARAAEPEPREAPEQKSKDTEAAAVIRRFFYVLGRLDKVFRRDGNPSPDREKRP